MFIFTWILHPSSFDLHLTSHMCMTSVFFSFFIQTPVYLNVVRIIFFFLIVTSPLTWLFLLEHRYIWKLIYTWILLQLFWGWGVPSNMYIRTEPRRHAVREQTPAPHINQTNIKALCQSSQNIILMEAVQVCLSWCCVHRPTQTSAVLCVCK